MTMIAPPRITHDFDSYSRILDARLDYQALIVSFADGSTGTILISAIENGFVRSQQVDWSRVTANIHEITVPAANGELIGIPWDSLRALSDQEYATRANDMSRSVAEELGNGIRSLRIAQDLDIHELARRAAISPAQLEQIENGELPVDLDIAEQLLEAMNLSLDDLSAVSQP